MKHKKIPVKLEIVLGVFLLATCWLVNNHIEMKVAEAREPCTNNTCTIAQEPSKSFSKARICDLKAQSDATFRSCLESKQKHTCYQSVKLIDSQVVELETKYFQNHREYPLCD